MRSRVLPIKTLLKSIETRLPALHWLIGLKRLLLVIRDLWYVDWLGLDCFSIDRWAEKNVWRATRGTGANVDWKRLLLRLFSWIACRETFQYFILINSHLTEWWSHSLNRKNSDSIRYVRIGFSSSIKALIALSTGQNILATDTRSVYYYASAKNFHDGSITRRNSIWRRHSSV